MLDKVKNFLPLLSLESVKKVFWYLRRGELAWMLRNMLAVARAALAGGSDRVPRRCNGYFATLLERDDPSGSRLGRRGGVDIILPVFNAFELTKACLESVLRNSENCRLIIVNDASPDPRIRPLLDALSADPSRKLEVMVLHQEENRGFLKSVNLAWRQTSRHFVVLNSDTEVPPGWLDRIFAPILAEPESIASVTPFSNCGMACSFPAPFEDHALPEGLALDAIDALFQEYGSPTPIDLFTGVGFCMAFNRGVVDSIGLFDEEAFGRGYGEECDWSLRALRAGYRNVLAPNIFVYHKHGGSFESAEKKALLAANLERFWSRHGDLRHLFEEISRKDEAADLRETLAFLVNLEGFDKGCVAVIDVMMTGGGTIYSANLVEQIGRLGHPVLHLRYDHVNEVLVLSCNGRMRQRDLVLPKELASRLSELLVLFEVRYAYVNELFSWPDPLQVMSVLASSDIRYSVLAHDYFLACPSWFLINSEGNFCFGSVDEEVCRNCLAANPYSGHHTLYQHTLDDVPLWRSAVLRLLRRADSLVCFSEASARYFRKLYPSLDNIRIIEHSVPDRELFQWERRTRPQSPLKIAVIGNLHHIKGEQVVRGVVEDAEFRALGVRLLVLGQYLPYSAGYSGKRGRFQVKGGYRREELPQLLEENDVAAVLIPSVWAETFSYTTSEALLMGYPVVCFDIGAQAERVRRCGGGIVVGDISAAGLKRALKELVASPELLLEAAERTANYIPLPEAESFAAVTAPLSGPFPPNEIPSAAMPEAADRLAASGV